MIDFPSYFWRAGPDQTLVAGLFWIFLYFINIIYNKNNKDVILPEIFFLFYMPYPFKTGAIMSLQNNVSFVTLSNDFLYYRYPPPSPCSVIFLHMLVRYVILGINASGGRYILFRWVLSLNILAPKITLEQHSISWVSCIYNR